VTTTARAALATSAPVDKCADSVENRRALWTSRPRVVVSSAGRWRWLRVDVGAPNVPAEVVHLSSRRGPRIHDRYPRPHRVRPPSRRARRTLAVHTLHTMMTVMTG